jgi:hypothetical protein
MVPGPGRRSHSNMIELLSAKVLRLGLLAPFRLMKRGHCGE